MVLDWEVKIFWAKLFGCYSLTTNDYPLFWGHQLAKRSKSSSSFCAGWMYLCLVC